MLRERSTSGVRGSGTARRSLARAVLAVPLMGVLAMVAACGQGGDAPAAGTQSRTNPFLGDGRMDQLQIDEELEMDLTDDGVPEEVLVSVYGDTPWSLEIELTVLGRGGSLLHESTWSSAEYPEFQRAQAQETPAWLASQAVRERLEDLLDEDSLRPLIQEEIDPAAVRWELQFDEWRHERGLPATVPLSPEDEAEVAAVQIPDARVRELLVTLPGRTAVRYQAGATFRTIVWSPELERFLTVFSCC